MTYLLALGLLAPGCSDDGPSTDDEAGDGDTGDGDGDPGDGDGDPGDGDGEAGDGDGDPGDGDGEAGDGDGDPLPTLPPGWLDELTEVGGCSDVYIAATNEAASVGLLFNGAELAATAHELDETQVRESVLPSEDVELRVVVGEQLDQGCSDVGGEGPIIEAEWTAVSGTVTLTVVPTGEPQPWEVPADATLELSDVVLVGEGMGDLMIESFTVTDVAVGWLPG